MLRAVRGLGYFGLLLALFEACSSNEATPPTPPAGPAHIEIMGVSLGHGLYDESKPETQLLSCDYTIGVNVLTMNWKLYPPGLCAGAPQCGQLRVSLLDNSSPDPLIQVLAAGNGVALDVAALVEQGDPLTWKPPASGNFTVRAELVDDSGKPYVEADGGDGSDTMVIDVTLPTDCTTTPGTGGSGGGEATGGNAGMGGEEAGAGASGAGGDQAIGGSGGSAGFSGSAGASGGSAGSNGGSSGTAGSTGGDQPIGGSAGSAGASAGATTGGAP